MTSLTSTVRIVAIGLWVATALLVPPALMKWFDGDPGRARAAVSSPAHAGKVSPFEAAVPWQSISPDDDDTPRAVDLRGNEIARPVARYRIDRRGTLYEVHSPDTEVPRLRPPRL
jgi:hypothetical protein